MYVAVPFLASFAGSLTKKTVPLLSENVQELEPKGSQSAQETTQAPWPHLFFSHSEKTGGFPKRSL